MIQPAPEAAGLALASPSLRTLLEVTRRLAAPVELRTILREVTQAACELLKAERASVWLLDEARGELVLEIAEDLPPVRLPLGTGLSGACARERRVIDVPDCYADPRFDPSIDRRSGFRTRNSLSLPLDALDGRLVGVLQVLNWRRHVPDQLSLQRELAEALAAQCAVALARALGIEKMREAQRMHRDLEVARLMQHSAMPASMPSVAGYSVHAAFQPAEQTGGDIYDLLLHDARLLMVIADATGHGIGPALSVTQLQAMLRLGLRSGGSLASVFRHVNDELCDRLPDGHFVTAFVGLLDPQAHRLSFISGGQAPILHYRAASADVSRHRATSFPMGAMPLDADPQPVTIDMAPGDWLVLLSDGMYEQESDEGEPFGRARVETLLLQAAGGTASGLVERLLAELKAFAPGRQDDDVTAVVLKRDS